MWLLPTQQGFLWEESKEAFLGYEASPSPARAKRNCIILKAKANYVIICHAHLWGCVSFFSSSICNKEKKSDINYSYLLRKMDLSKGKWASPESGHDPGIDWSELGISSCHCRNRRKEKQRQRRGREGLARESKARALCWGVPWGEILLVGWTKGLFPTGMSLCISCDITMGSTFGTNSARFNILVNVADWESYIYWDLWCLKLFVHDVYKQIESLQVTVR